MDTVAFTRVESFFDNAVQIDEIKEYGDDRGFVSEVWRLDDDQYNQATPKMCYYSHTQPFIMRGPHEHTTQVDFFITIKSQMLYMFVKGDKANFFITNPNKIYRVKVGNGIIHSYRNISTAQTAVTANFPSSLFKGPNKSEPIDEKRYEPEIEKNKNIYVLGAGGRLGNAVFTSLLQDMGFHKYNVIPVFDKFDDKSIEKLLDLISHNKFRTENDVIINCIGKTNVQESGSDFMLGNFIIPRILTNFAITEKIHLVHFSTDYVYQTGNISEYTKSKKSYESWIETLYESQFQYYPELQKYLHVIRVANLFSQAKTDVHNAVNKIISAYQKGPLNIVENSSIMLTDVAHIADFISKKYIHSITDYPQFINISGKCYTIEHVIKELFGVTDAKFNYITEPKVINNPHLFLNRSNYYQLDCDSAIKEKAKNAR
jgi:dTDP-4-dehydrorhamnose reductase/dTDP-4-dehydrorhamnose 3,5-epimerase-like enzyme